MRRSFLFMMAGTMLLTIFAGVAVAQRTINCSEQSPDDEGGKCRGTNQRDTILGTAFDDVIKALRKGDDITAGEGDDSVNAGRGGDDVDGGEGDDTLKGKRGSDTLNDTDGADTDRVFGGRGRDTINVQDGDTNDTVKCGRDRDTVTYDQIGTLQDEIAGNCETLVT